MPHLSTDTVNELQGQGRVLPRYSPMLARSPCSTRGNRAEELQCNMTRGIAFNMTRGIAFTVLHAGMPWVKQPVHISSVQPCGHEVKERSPGLRGAPCSV